MGVCAPGHVRMFANFIATFKNFGIRVAILRESNFTVHCDTNIYFIYTVQEFTIDRFHKELVNKKIFVDIPLAG